MYALIGLDAMNFFQQALAQNFHQTSGDLERILWALRAVITFFRADSNILISRLAICMVSDCVFHLVDGERYLPVRQCIISLVGWCSLLFVPSRTIVKGAFDLGTQGARCFIRTSVALDNAERPIDELLRWFGELLPKQWMVSTHAIETRGSLRFHVSNLNIATLKKLADVKIIWVDSVSAHLDFHPSHYGHFMPLQSPTILQAEFIRRLVLSEFLLSIFLSRHF